MYVKIVEVEMGIDHAQCSERGVAAGTLLPIRKTR